MSGKGCLIGVVVVGIVAAVSVNYMYKAGKGALEDIASGIGVSPDLVEEAQDLNRKYAFSKPNDDGISEDQIKKFIAIKQDFAGKFNRHRSELEALGERADGETGFGEAREAYKILGEIRRDFLKSLRENEMSPREYAFLTGQIYGTYLADAAKKSYEQVSSALPTARENMKQQLAALRERIADPATSAEMRKSLEQAMESLQGAMQDVSAGQQELKEEYKKLPEKNIELVNKYRAELENLNTLGIEYWGLAMAGLE